MSKTAAKRTMSALLATGAFALATSGVAQASLSQDVIYEQDFSEDADDWTGGDGVYGSVTHNPDDETATIEGAAEPSPLGPFSYFGGTTLDSDYRMTWPEHGYLTELDVYLDPANMDDGDGFDLSVASSREDNGDHLRDFIFHVGMVDGVLLVNGSNNSDWSFNPAKLTQGDGGTAIQDAGWYTLQHSFRDQDGSLAVDLNLLDSNGDMIFTTTRFNVNDEIDGVVGGARYMWFVYASAPFDIDNQRLIHLVPAPDAPVDKRECMRGGYEAFGFNNQGQCVASVQANENAGK